jgi:hypothetical protein
VTLPRIETQEKAIQIGFSIFSLQQSSELKGNRRGERSLTLFRRFAQPNDEEVK